MLQATAQVRRRLAELELDMDRQQGWVRGGTKSEVSLLTISSIQNPLCPYAYVLIISICKFRPPAHVHRHDVRLPRAQKLWHFSD